MRRLRGLAVVLAYLLLAGCGGSAPPGPDPSTPSSAAKVDGAALTAAIEARIAGGSVALQTIDAVLVSVDGQPVVTLYRNGHPPEAALHVWSVAKSVTSALVGLAIEDGLIDGLDATLAELLPEHRAQMSDELAGVTLRQLMTMSAGFREERQDPTPFADMLNSDDGVGYVLEHGLVEEPGTQFAYSNVGAHLVTAVLAAALERADGKDARSVLEYAEQRLFEPLGVDTSDAYSGRVRLEGTPAFIRAGFGWGTDAQGVNTGCCALKLTPADMLKLGELYVDDGTWRGRRVLPPGWVAQTVAPSATSPQYGLMWWLDPSVAGGPEHTARGSRGQLVLVSPEDRVVVAIGSVPFDDGTAITDEDALALAREVVLPAFS